MYYTVERETCIHGYHIYNAIWEAVVRKELEVLSYLLKSVFFSIMPGKGKCVNTTAKTIIFNTYLYFK